jgi:hypothetical protein
VTVATQHRLKALFDNAAERSFPPADGKVEVLPSPTGPCDVVLAFTNHAVVAADLPAHWVELHVTDPPLEEHEHHPVLGPHFLAALAERLGTPPAGTSMLLAAPSEPTRTVALEPGGQDPAGWADCRLGVRNFRYSGLGGTGSVSLGYGPAGRADVWIGVDGESALASPVRGRDLLSAARSLVEPGTALFASVPVHSARSIRMAVATGFRPVGAEVLFCTRNAG